MMTCLMIEQATRADYSQKHLNNCKSIHYEQIGNPALSITLGHATLWVTKRTRSLEYNSGFISLLMTYSFTLDTMTHLQLQLNPSPVYPWLHTHSNVPAEMSLHSALASQASGSQST